MILGGELITSLRSCSSAPRPRLGIKDVLGHQAVLAQQSIELLDGCPGTSHIHMAMERLSTIQTAVMQDSFEPAQSSILQLPTKQRQQLLLSLADLQREVLGAEEHQQQQQSVLEQYQAVCEVLSGQLSNAVSMLVERNNLIDAVSRKQNELTAKLAIQVWPSMYVCSLSCSYQIPPVVPSLLFLLSCKN